MRAAGSTSKLSAEKAGLRHGSLGIDPSEVTTMYRRKPEPNAVLPPNSGFSRRLEYLMIRYGHTAVSLAKKTGMKESTIRSYCYGCREPEGLTRISTLADAFGVTMDWLCGRSERGGPR